MENKNKAKSKAIMMFSLGEKRIEKFKALADDKELNYSAILQMLIDDWIDKVEGQKKDQ